MKLLVGVKFDNCCICRVKWQKKYNCFLDFFLDPFLFDQLKNIFVTIFEPANPNATTKFCQVFLLLLLLLRVFLLLWQVEKIIYSKMILK